MRNILKFILFIWISGQCLSQDSTELISLPIIHEFVWVDFGGHLILCGLPCSNEHRYCEYKWLDKKDSILYVYCHQIPEDSVEIALYKPKLLHFSDINVVCWKPFYVLHFAKNEEELFDMHILNEENESTLSDFIFECE